MLVVTASMSNTIVSTAIKWAVLRRKRTGRRTCESNQLVVSCKPTFWQSCLMVLLPLPPEENPSCQIPEESSFKKLSIQALCPLPPPHCCCAECGSSGQQRCCAVKEHETAWICHCCWYCSSLLEITQQQVLEASIEACHNMVFRSYVLTGCELHDEPAYLPASDGAWQHATHHACTHTTAVSFIVALSQAHACTLVTAGGTELQVLPQLLLPYVHGELLRHPLLLTDHLLLCWYLPQRRHLPACALSPEQTPWHSCAPSGCGNSTCTCRQSIPVVICNACAHVLMFVSNKLACRKQPPVQDMQGRCNRLAKTSPVCQLSQLPFVCTNQLIHLTAIQVGLRWQAWK
jgi:hypothetical protein